MQAKASGEEEGKIEGSGKRGEWEREGWQLSVYSRQRNGEEDVAGAGGAGGACRDELRPTD